jgi:hypothetical protein
LHPGRALHGEEQHMSDDVIGTLAQANMRDRHAREHVLDNDGASTRRSLAWKQHADNDARWEGATGNAHQERDSCR